MSNMLQMGASLGQSNTVNVGKSVLFEREGQVLTYTFNNSGVLTFVVETTPAGNLMPVLSLADSKIGIGAPDPDHPLNHYVTETSPNNFKPVNNQSSQDFTSECLKKDWEYWLASLAHTTERVNLDGGEWPDERCIKEFYDQALRTVHYRVFVSWSEWRNDRLALIGKWLNMSEVVASANINPCTS
jgi:hypothetical protein